MSNVYAPPPGAPPPTSTASTARPPVRQDSQDVDIPDEPPPAYSSVANGETTLEAGPSRMDFSGPPPVPDRLSANITGVGVGYEPRRHTPPHESNPFHDSLAPPSQPPRHPSYPAPAPGAQTPSPGAGPSRPPAPKEPDLSPTETPTPGRPLLRNGMMLVYPKGHYCHKCYNTGYKGNDPSNPHDADWRKYGKPYNAALAASYRSAHGPGANPTVQSASNFQRPLPSFQPPYASPHPPPPPPTGQFAHLPPPPGKWNTYPGQGAHHPPSPTPPGPLGPGGQIQWHRPPSGPYFGTHAAFPPPDAIVLQPGDPRIGGNVCWKCGGSGREISFFGFDDGVCYLCRGVGRVF